ncbi:hypothetical protein [Spelaeicoccus albus]|uniref:Uncharacterized protein n=1 Tax=Spelaeicoccus albus TaxID=1280376 RepID=A0A7Z0D3J7_9MICO|nr:hypothetical protein [Spelaeicoccus albus]NYI68232.1 hypothetical protein [Spelaeicoccus albus]
MDDAARRWHPYARSRDEDLDILAHGGETGWWDHTGRPAPWPKDFLDPDAGWTTSASIDNHQAANNPEPKNPPT